MLVFAALVPAGAFAEDAAPIPTPAERPASAPSAAAPAAPQKFYLELEQADLATLSQALNELPYRIAAPLLLKLQGQLQAQQQLKEAADKSISDPVEKAKKRK
jgi:hypothetical protein